VKLPRRGGSGLRRHLGQGAHVGLAGRPEHAQRREGEAGLAHAATVDVGGDQAAPALGVGRVDADQLAIRGDGLGDAAVGAQAVAVLDAQRDVVLDLADAHLERGQRALQLAERVGLDGGELEVGAAGAGVVAGDLAEVAEHRLLVGLPGDRSSPSRPL
jgi:hypothetical protein